MAASKYRVIVSGSVRPERDRAEVLAALAALFHSNSETMQQLLQGKPTALTKHYDRAEAMRIHDAIHQAGAQCEIELVVARGDGDGGDGGDDDALARRHSGLDAEVQSSTDGDLHAGGNAPKRKRDSRLQTAGMTADGDGDEDESERESPRADSTRDDSTRDDSTHDDFADDDFAHDESPRDDSPLMRFVAVNTKYYRRQFAKFGDLERAAFAFSWHWPAF
ncbi:MAG: hypothetical protein ACR2P7_09415, partial [bacterium]